KTIARGMPGCSGEPVVTTSCAFLFLHARLRVHRAPGIPCALILFRGGRFMHNSGVFTPRERGGVTHVRRPCESRDPQSQVFLGGKAVSHRAKPRGRGVWVPAFAGTTAMMG